jgi:DNA invertase Pin-like site-specific DNA recombinase
MTIFAGHAEFERDLIRERIGAGREAAKKQGVRFGRPRKLTLDQGELASALFRKGSPSGKLLRRPEVNRRLLSTMSARAVSTFRGVPKLKRPQSEAWTL